MRSLKLSSVLILTLCLFIGWPPTLPSVAEQTGGQGSAADRARALLADGQQSLQRDEYIEAAGTLQRATELYRTTDDRIGEARSLLHLGRAHVAQGQYQQARSEIERALKLFQSGSDQPGQAHARLDLGALLRGQASFAQARQQIESALSLYQRQRDKLGEATAHLEMGRVHRAQGRYQQAESALKTALTQYRELQNRLGEADTRLELSPVLRFQGDSAQSRKEAEAALDLYLKSQSQRGEADARLRLGILDALEGLYAQARTVYEASIAIYRRLAMRPREGYALRLLARLQRLQGRYQEAETTFAQALALALALEDRQGEAEIRWNLGQLYLLRGQYQEARKALDNALALYKQTEDLQGIPDVYQDLGLLSQFQGRYREAQESFTTALALYQKNSNRLGEAYARRNLALLYGLQSNYSQARTQLDQALKIFQGLKSRMGEAYTRLEMGNLSRLQKQYSDSEAQYRRSLGLYKEMGAVYGEAEVYKELGVLFRTQGRLDDAKRALATSRDLLGRLQAPEILWQVLYETGTIQEREGLAANALRSYQEAVKLFEELAGQFTEGAAREQYLHAENRLAVYDALTRLLLELHKKDSSRGYDREALAVQERKKERIVADALAVQPPAFRDPTTQQVVTELQDKAAQVAALDRQLTAEQKKPSEQQRSDEIQRIIGLRAQTKKEFLAARDALLKKNPQIKARFPDQHAIDLTKLARDVDNLPPGVLLAAYYPTENSLWIFLAARGQQFRSLEVPAKQSALYAKVRNYRQMLGRAASAQQRLPWQPDRSAVFEREVAPLRRLSVELYDLLIRPIEAEVTKAQGLIVAPSDLLLYLPFHALTAVEPDGRLKFLAERIVITYITQLELDDLLKPEALPPLQLLALGNPDGTLRYAEREVQSLVRLFPNSTSLIRDKATKTALELALAQTPKILFWHLATHAILGKKRADETYLVLANNERLAISDIEGLDLPRKGLVTLSACETAVGEQTPGAALLTLARAFSVGGFPAILASLWKVNDAATLEFMLTFYKAMATEGRAKAMQSAQRKLIGDPETAHPFYWAAFGLWGAR